MVFRKGVSWSHVYSVFRFSFLRYDGSTARLDIFSHSALKLDLQNICSFFRFALFDGEINPCRDKSIKKF